MKTLRVRLMLPLALLILLVGPLGLVSQHSGLAHAATDLTVCPSGTPRRGVDVSHYDGSIDWTQVATAGISFGYAKATEGTTFIDPSFQTNFAAMKAAGVKRGAYLFFRPRADPTAQVNFFLSTLLKNGFTSGDLIPVIDVEVTDGLSSAVLASNLQMAANTIQAALGVSPVIYSSAVFWNGSVGSTAFGGDPLWVANWAVNCPNIPLGWSTWTLWQYADNGTVSGIPSSVDLDQSNGPTLPIYNVASLISDLITLVNSFNLSPGGIQTSFDSQLQVVQADLAANNTAQACSDLTSFINHVNAQSGKLLTTAQASQLLATAKQVQTILAC